MNISEYLENLITEVPSYALIKEDKKMIQIEGIEEFILRKLKSTRYIGSKMPKELLNLVTKVVKETVQENKPLHFTIPFGGYKKPQWDSAPHIDWSEVFNTIQLRAYLAPIIEVYKPGVIINYFSDEIFVSRMNNISQKDLDIYNDEMKELLSVMNSYTSENMSFKFSKIRDEITSGELHKRFDIEINKLRGEWESLSKDAQEFRINKAERNYDGDLTNLSEEDKYNVLLDSTLVHDAFIFGDWREGVPWAFDDHMIPIGFRYTGDWGIHLKSSRSSTVQFWVGRGVLKRYREGYIPTILTYEQYISVGDKKIEKIESVLKGVSPIFGEIELVGV